MRLLGLARRGSAGRVGGRRAVALGAAALGAALSLGCGTKPEEVIVRTASAEVPDALVDRDPLALLPGGALGVTKLDAKQLFASPFGGKLLAVVGARLPFPPSAGFDPARDLEALYAGYYTWTGVDVCAVAVGRFDPAAIEAAAGGTQQSPLGQPIVKSTYAGRTLYTAGNLGFVVLTRRTALLGNETGIRRTLDRLHEGRARRSLPQWLEQLLATQGAPMVAGFSLKGNLISGTVAQQLAFLNGAETVRIVGNFQPPGMNFAGAVTYPDAAAAQSGTAQIQGTYNGLASLSGIASLFGMRNPFASFQVQTSDREAQFVAGFDENGVTQAIGMLAQLSGLPGIPKTVQATGTDGAQAP